MQYQILVIFIYRLESQMDGGDDTQLLILNCC